MKLNNLDKMAAKKAEVMASLSNAIKSDDAEGYAAAFEQWTEMVQDAVMAEARGLVQANDNQILAGRGVRVLTSEEKSYYQKVIGAMKSDNPKQAFTGLDTVMPKTVFETVFEDITEEHPLLSVIDFQSAAALIETVYTTSGRHEAKWGPLCGDINKALTAEFKLMDLSQTRLFAHVLICKAMLDLGPEWLDRFIRVILFEAIANGLEYGVIQGRGVADKADEPTDRIFEPVGMVRDLKDYDNETGYAKKEALEVTEITPETWGELAGEFAVSPNGLYRVVPELLLVVNPIDYLTKVMPATTYLTPQGTYVNNVFPLPTRVVQTAYLEEGEAVLGIAKMYFGALGTGKEGKLEHSDDYKFYEDQRAYLIKLYGNGTPKDNTSFIVLNIEDLKAPMLNVNVDNYEASKLPLNEDGSLNVGLLFTEGGALKVNVENVDEFPEA